MAFALYAMKVVLATVLARFRLRLAKPGPLRVSLQSFFFGVEGGTQQVRASTSPDALRPSIFLRRGPSNLVLMLSQPRSARREAHLVAVEDEELIVKPLPELTQRVTHS